ncbi:rhs family protein [Yersinia massiliensis]|uniref:hypothetical protein n=1 Tax=Yersinia massiliensis TaxID=419257 RepID=UPI0005E28BE5|nr:hypothetical protein [Yersinia massiliensis]CNI32653.1 rhs family protein [Yersinia massiliensis]
MNDKNSYDHHAVRRNGINAENLPIKEHKDKSGNVLRDQFDIHGKLIWREKLVYSKKDKTTSKVITQFTRNDKGSIINRHDEVYSASGELIECKELVRTGSGESAITRRSEYQYRDGNISYNSEETLNSNGDILNQTGQFFYPCGNISSSHSSLYSDGVLIEVKVLKNTVDIDNNINHSEIKHYDDKNKLVSSSERSHFDYREYDERTVSFRERKYDSRGKLVEIVAISQGFHENGSVSSMNETFYRSEQDLDNDLILKEIDSGFDGAGNLTFRHESDGNEMRSIHQEFDSFGKLKSKVKKDSSRYDGLTYKENTYTYDANGVEIGAVEITHTHDDSSRKLQSSDEFHRTNDSKGQMTSSTTIRKEYDSNGNLISSVEDKSNPAGEFVSDPTKESISSSENKLTEHTTATQKYNDQTTEKFTKKETSDADVNFSERIKNIYDKNGVRIKSVTISEEINSANNRTYLAEEIQEFGYDGKLIVKVVDSYKFKFGSDGKVLSQTQSTQEFKSDGELTFCSGGKYDADGNKTKDFSDTSGHDGEHRHLAHKYETLDHLMSAMNSFDLNEGVPTSVETHFMSAIKPNTLVAPV